MTVPKASPPTPGGRNGHHYHHDYHDHDDSRPCAACLNAGYQPRTDEGWDTTPCSVCAMPLCTGETTWGCADEVSGEGGCYCAGCDGRMCAEHTDWCDGCAQELGYSEEPFCLGCLHECPHCEAMSCARHKDGHRCPAMWAGEEEEEEEGGGERGVGQGSSAPLSP